MKEPMRFRESLFLPLFWVNRRRMTSGPPAVRKAGSCDRCQKAPHDHRGKSEGTGCRAWPLSLERTDTTSLSAFRWILRSSAERVVSAGQGIGGERKIMKLIEQLAKAAGAAVGSSRPVAETLKYVPLNRYVACPARNSRATYTLPAAFPVRNSI